MIIEIMAIIFLGAVMASIPFVKETGNIIFGLGMFLVAIFLSGSIIAIIP